MDSKRGLPVLERCHGIYKNTDFYSAITFLIMPILATPEGRAQQRQLVRFELLAANTKYTEQHSISVSDISAMSSEYLKMFERSRVIRSSSAGVRVKEWWKRGMTDFTETDGLGNAYHVLLMENGHKISCE